MGAIIIETKDLSELKFIREILSRTRIKSKELNKEEYEDFLLGSITKKEKTGKTVSKVTILKKLK